MKPAIDWGLIEADVVARGLTHAEAAEAHGVSVSAVDQHFAAGKKTSWYMPPSLAGRWRIVRAYTGYRYRDGFELGLIRIEAELSAAFAWPPAKPCWHERRYPNGRCCQCFEAAWGTAEGTPAREQERSP